jgi:hypothetical protein
METKYYPVRLCISIEQNSAYIVLIIDDYSKHYINLPLYKIYGQIEKLLPNNPLIILEDVDRNKNIGFKSTREIIIQLIIDQLEDYKANYLLLPNCRVPTSYVNKYKDKGIAVEYHKPLWLCTYNLHK